MIFSSKAFFIFLPIVLLIYHSLRGRSHKYNFLLFASWVFYSWWSLRFLWVIVLLTIIDYLAGRFIDSTDDLRRKRRWLLLSIVANLGLLGVFKYTGFFVDNSIALARVCGFDVPAIVINIALPLGISFHTFQGMSYTLDVYRGQIKAINSFRDYALFVAFFPQLVAGPIVRAVEFLPQMVTPPPVTSEKVIDGLHWFIVGLFKKIFIADWLALYVAAVFSHPEQYDAWSHRWAVVAWAMQIYCDFSGYSDMAVGCAKWFGFELPRNFNYPYLASSVTDFWRRWHMTLSTWLRDYLYFPLGGSRGSNLRTCGNLMILFLLCGLWHGAAWNWLLYGVYHGFLMVIHRLWSQSVTGIDWLDQIRASSLWRGLSIVATFWMLLIGLVFVRMVSWKGCWLMLGSLVGISSGGAESFLPAYVPFLITLVIAGHLFSGLRNRICGLLEMPSVIRAGAYVGALALLVVFNPGVGKPFIYFQF